MRLIDANELIEYLCTPRKDIEQYCYPCKRIFEEINEIQTVEAIPIEFIEELIGQYNDWNEDVEPLIKLIEKWRENNEITG